MPLKHVVCNIQFDSADFSCLEFSSQYFLIVVTDVAVTVRYIQSENVII